MAVYIKNIDSVTHIFRGREVSAGNYFQIPEMERPVWHADEMILQHITDDEAMIAKSDDGNNDIADKSQQWNYLGNLVPPTVDLSYKTPGGTPLMAFKKADGISFTAVTHDFTNKCSWYQGSLQNVDEVLTGSGVGPYSGSEDHWIDVESGIVYQQHKYPQYLPVIKIDDVVQTTGYTIDYASGEVTFDSTTSGTVKATYNYASSGDFILEPEAGKVIGLEHSEIQFTKDVMITAPVNFEVWVYNPLFNPGLSVDPDDKTFIPGVSSGNPLRFLYKHEKYNNIKDIINTANLGQGYIPAMGGITEDILVFPFNYVTEIKLASSVGAQMRVTLDSHTAFTGEWATGTFYCISEAE